MNQADPTPSEGALTQPQHLAARLQQAWRRGQRPPLSEFLAGRPEPAPAELADLVRLDQRERWRAGERVHAEEYLGRYPALAAHPEHALDLVYGEFLLRESLGETPSPAEYLGRFPHLAEALKLQLGLHAALGQSSLPPAPRPVVAGYEVLEEIGRGGMGVVYKARQLSLDRLVALKMIRADDPWGENLARFKCEAEALARLRHPNVVQIFEVGEDQGKPFLVMELLGVGLDKALARVPQPPRESAQLVAVLARAVHAAHEHGIIHRDLKPSNVLLQPLTAKAPRKPRPDEKRVEDLVEDRGSSVEDRQEPPVSSLDPPSSILDPQFSSSLGDLGDLAVRHLSPKITDFGLAKQIPETEASEAGFTVTGTILGTPCYLAPEQARGEARAVTFAADVYALGAILYELLTGRPPFQGATVLETLEQVRSQEPTPPTRLVPRTPRDLEVICLKCLEKEPARRYGSASELADDLQRFLGGTPVLARPTPLWERGWKLAKRRPAVASLSVALVCALLGLAGLGAWSYLSIRSALADAGRANEDLTRALASKEEQRQEAERRRKHERRNFRIARHAIDQFCTHVSQDRLLNTPGMAPLRTALLRAAASFYDQFVREGSDDPEVQAERAKAYMRYAQLTSKMKALDDSLPLCKQGLAIFEKLAERPGATAEDRRNLAEALDDLGVLYSQAGRFGEAEKAYLRGVRLMEKLPAEEADSAESRETLSLLWSNLGILYKDSGPARPAEEALKRAVRLNKALLRTRKDPRYEKGQSTDLHVLAGLLMAQGRFKEAEGPCREGLVLARRLHRLDPDDVAYTINLAWNESCRGTLCLHLARLAEAEEATGRACDLFGKLVKDHPDLLECKKGLGVALRNRGGARQESKPKLAEADYRAAARCFGELCRLDKAHVEYALGLGACQASLGDLSRARGAKEEALDWLTRAGATLEPVKHFAPAGAMLPLVLSDRARLLLDMGRMRESARDWRRALDLAGPSAPAGWRPLHGLALLEAGRLDEAEAVGRDLLARKDLDPGALYDTACLFARCAVAARDDARLAPPRRARRAEEHAARAVQLLARAGDAGFFTKPDNRDQVDRDTDLDVLRTRPDFKAWRAKAFPTR